MSDGHAHQVLLWIIFWGRNDAQKIVSVLGRHASIRPKSCAWYSVHHFVVGFQEKKKPHHFFESKTGQGFSIFSGRITSDSNGLCFFISLKIASFLSFVLERKEDEFFERLGSAPIANKAQHTLATRCDFRCWRTNANRTASFLEPKEPIPVWHRATYLNQIQNRLFE